jgi:3',5'-cyclic-AMP phosphodiesterase
MAKLIWFSDLHFKSVGLNFGHDPRVRLEVVIDYVSAHHSDAEFCVISGDMVEDATPAICADLAKRLERLPFRVLPMVGNHDVRSMFRAALPLPDSAQETFVQYAVQLTGLRVICLDTLTEGSSDGSFCKAREAWLRDELARDRVTPTVVFCHHPPLDLGLPALDRTRVANGQVIVDMLSDAPNIRQLLFGHVHRPTLGVAQGVPYASIRSVLYQAPPPVPAWDWESFTPALEASDIGVITFEDDVLRIQFEPFCDARTGLVLP